MLVAAPVIPVAINGAWRALRRGGLPRPLTHVSVEFLPVIAEAERADADCLSEATRAAIARHLT